MIWYDALTKEPVAPGACEDSGDPSIEGYDCYDCKQHIDVEYKRYLGVGYGLCVRCGLIVLTTGPVLDTAPAV